MKFAKTLNLNANKTLEIKINNKIKLKINFVSEIFIF